jgi:hypothetical protein
MRQICEEGRGHCIPVPLLLGADRGPLLVTVHFKQIKGRPEYVALQRGAMRLRKHLNRLYTPPFDRRYNCAERCMRVCNAR